MVGGGYKLSINNDNNNNNNNKNNNNTNNPFDDGSLPPEKVSKQGYKKR